MGDTVLQCRGPTPPNAHPIGHKARVHVSVLKCSSTALRAFCCAPVSDGKCLLLFPSWYSPGEVRPALTAALLLRSTRCRAAVAALGAARCHFSAPQSKKNRAVIIGNQPNADWSNIVVRCATNLLPEQLVVHLHPLHLFVALL